MIRILHVINRMGYGGIETFIMNLYRQIDKSKIQFDFAVHTEEKGEYDEEIKRLGGKIYYFTSRNSSIFQYYKDWNMFLKNNGKNYNAIHMHVSSLTTILPIYLAKKYNINQRIIHAHSTCQKGFIHRILMYVNKIRVSNYSNVRLACSTEAGKYVFGNNSYELFHNGINIEKYLFNDKIREKIRKEYSINENDKAYVHVGSFCYAKNHTFLIDVFKNIKKIENGSKLFLIGNGELIGIIKEKVKNYNLEEDVIFLGLCNNVGEILQAMDIFIFPSNYEGLPMATIEAQASGLPVYASNNISKEIKISDLVTFLDLENGSEKWAKIITNNKIKRLKNSSEIIRKANYDIAYLVDDITKIYCNKK